MKKIICLLSMVLALSCATEKRDVPVFNLADAGKVDVNPDFVLNDIVESATYLQLEGNDSVFHCVSSICSINDNGDYCIVDNRMNVICIYNKDGEIVSNFSRYGRGNGEYLHISTLTFDGDDKIDVLQEDAGIIYQYNKKGEFKSKINIKGAFLVTPLGGGKYLSLMSVYEGGGAGNFVNILDSEYNVVERFFEVDSTKLDGTVSNVNVITKCDNGYNFALNTFNGGNVYYNYNTRTNSFTEICRFDCSPYNLTRDAFTNGGSIIDFILMIEPHKVGKYLFVQFSNRGELNTDIWNFSTGEMIARRSTKASSGGLMAFQLPDGTKLTLGFKGYSVHNDQFAFLCDPAELSGKIPQDIDPDGNSVVVTLKLKQ